MPFYATRPTQSVQPRASHSDRGRPLVIGTGSKAAVLDQYLHDISQYPVHTRDEETACARAAVGGDPEAMDALIRANLRFVVSVAKKFQNLGVPLEDLIAEGNIGLMRAARKFDPDRGIKFISYAVWWIRQALHSAIAEQGRAVRIPLNRATVYRRAARLAAKLSAALGRPISASELAVEAGIDLDEAELALTISRVPLSLDAPIGPDGGGTVGDHIADVQADSPDDSAHAGDRLAAVESAIQLLAPREALIIRLYFGFAEGEPKTLEQIGAMLGITRERVRQIKERSLIRLRDGRSGRPLRAYRAG